VREATMMTKKKMVLEVVRIYGRGSKMAMFFAGIATNSDYLHTKNIFQKIMKKHLDNKNKV
jgi:hypothetical protein